MKRFMKRLVTICMVLPLTMSIATLRWLNTGNAGGRTGKTKPIKYGRAELNWLHQHGLRWVDKQRKGRGRKTAPGLPSRHER